MPKEDAMIYEHQDERCPASSGVHGLSRKRSWLPWSLCKFVDLDPPPPFGLSKPKVPTQHELSTMTRESEDIFPVGFYDMTVVKRGVTKGRGFWKGKEALRLAHCSAEKNGCRFKARFCRVANGLQIFTSGQHNLDAHLAPRKRGLAPAARAVVTQHCDQPHDRLVGWLQDSGILQSNHRRDIERVKQQVKRRKMTLKRQGKRLGQSVPSTSQHLLYERTSIECTCENNGKQEECCSLGSDSSFSPQTCHVEGDDDDDPLFNAPITFLHDECLTSLKDSPPCHPPEAAEALIKDIPDYEHIFPTSFTYEAVKEGATNTPLLHPQPVCQLTEDFQTYNDYLQTTSRGLTTLRREHEEMETHQRTFNPSMCYYPPSFIYDTGAIEHKSVPFNLSEEWHGPIRQAM